MLELLKAKKVEYINLTSEQKEIDVVVSDKARFSSEKERVYVLSNKAYEKKFTTRNFISGPQPKKDYAPYSFHIVDEIIFRPNVKQIQIFKGSNNKYNACVFHGNKKIFQDIFILEDAGWSEEDLNNIDALPWDELNEEQGEQELQEKKGKGKEGYSVEIKKTKSSDAIKKKLILNCSRISTLRNAISKDEQKYRETLYPQSTQTTPTLNYDLTTLEGCLNLIKLDEKLEKKVDHRPENGSPDLGAFFKEKDQRMDFFMMYASKRGEVNNTITSARNYNLKLNAVVFYDGVSSHFQRVKKQVEFLKQIKPPFLEMAPVVFDINKNSKLDKVVEQIKILQRYELDINFKVHGLPELAEEPCIKLIVSLSSFANVKKTGFTLDLVGDAKQFKMAMWGFSFLKNLMFKRGDNFNYKFKLSKDIKQVVFSPSLDEIDNYQSEAFKMFLLVADYTQEKLLLKCEGSIPLKEYTPLSGNQKIKLVSTTIFLSDTDIEREFKYDATATVAPLKDLLESIAKQDSESDSDNENYVDFSRLSLVSFNTLCEKYGDELDALVKAEQFLGSFSFVETKSSEEKALKEVSFLKLNNKALELILMKEMTFGDDCISITPEQYAKYLPEYDNFNALRCQLEIRKGAFLTEELAERCLKDEALKSIKGMVLTSEQYSRFKKRGELKFSDIEFPAIKFSKIKIDNTSAVEKRVTNFSILEETEVVSISSCHLTQNQYVELNQKKIPLNDITLFGDVEIKDEKELSKLIGSEPSIGPKFLKGVNVKWNLHQSRKKQLDVKSIKTLMAVYKDNNFLSEKIIHKAVETKRYDGNNFLLMMDAESSIPLKKEDFMTRDDGCAIFLNKLKRYYKIFEPCDIDMAFKEKVSPFYNAMMLSNQNERVLVDFSGSSVDITVNRLTKLKSHFSNISSHELILKDICFDSSQRSIDVITVNDFFDLPNNFILEGIKFNGLKSDISKTDLSQLLGFLNKYGGGRVVEITQSKLKDHFNVVINEQTAKNSDDTRCDVNFHGVTLSMLDFQWLEDFPKIFAHSFKNVTLECTRDEFRIKQPFSQSEESEEKDDLTKFPFWNDFLSGDKNRCHFTDMLWQHKELTDLFSFREENIKADYVFEEELTVNITLKNYKILTLEAFNKQADELNKTLDRLKLKKKKIIFSLKENWLWSCSTNDNDSLTFSVNGQVFKTNANGTVRNALKCLLYRYEPEDLNKNIILKMIAACGDEALKMIWIDFSQTNLSSKHLDMINNLALKNSSINLVLKNITFNSLQPEEDKVALKDILNLPANVKLREARFIKFSGDILVGGFSKLLNFLEKNGAGRTVELKGATLSGSFNVEIKDDDIKIKDEDAGLADGLVVKKKQKKKKRKTKEKCMMTFDSVSLNAFDLDRLEGKEATITSTFDNVILNMTGHELFAKIPSLETGEEQEEPKKDIKTTKKSHLWSRFFNNKSNKCVLVEASWRYEDLLNLLKIKEKTNFQATTSFKDEVFLILDKSDYASKINSIDSLQNLAINFNETFKKLNAKKLKVSWLSEQSISLCLDMSEDELNFSLTINNKTGHIILPNVGSVKNILKCLFHVYEGVDLTNGIIKNMLKANCNEFSESMTIDFFETNLETQHLNSINQFPPSIKTILTNIRLPGTNAENNITINNLLDLPPGVKLKNINFKSFTSIIPRKNFKKLVKFLEQYGEGKNVTIELPRLSNDFKITIADKVSMKSSPNVDETKCDLDFMGGMLQAAEFQILKEFKGGFNISFEDVALDGTPDIVELLGDERLSFNNFQFKGLKGNVSRNKLPGLIKCLECHNNEILITVGPTNPISHDKVGIEISDNNEERKDVCSNISFQHLTLSEKELSLFSKMKNIRPGFNRMRFEISARFYMQQHESYIELDYRRAGYCQRLQENFFLWKFFERNCSNEFLIMDKNIDYKKLVSLFDLQSKSNAGIKCKFLHNPIVLKESINVTDLKILKERSIFQEEGLDHNYDFIFCDNRTGVNVLQQFYNGKFSDEEKHYLESHSRFPSNTTFSSGQERLIAESIRLGISFKNCVMRKEVNFVTVNKILKELNPDSESKSHRNSFFSFFSSSEDQLLFLDMKDIHLVHFEKKPSKKCMPKKYFEAIEEKRKEVSEKISDREEEGIQMQSYEGYINGK